MRDALASEFGYSAINELAVKSIQQALVECGTRHLPSMFASREGDVLNAVRRLYEPEHFAALTRTFFSRYIANVVAFVSSKHEPSIGENPRIVHEAEAWSQDLTSVLSAYSQDWLAKHRFHKTTELSYGDTSGFVAFAFRKLEKAMSLTSEDEVDV